MKQTRALWALLLSFLGILLPMPGKAIEGLAYSTFVGPSSRAVNAMVADPSGNLYVVETSSPFTGLTIAKYDSLGNQMWSKLYGVGDQSAQASGIALDASQNVYICGSVNPTGANQDALLVKYSNDGTFRWDFLYDGFAAGTDSFAGLAVDNAGNSFAVGTTDAGGGQGTNMLVVKLNTDSVLQYAKTYDRSDGNGTSNEQGLFIKLDPSGNPIAAGNTDYVDFNTQTHHRHVFLRKILSDGSFLGAYFVEGSQDLAAGLGVNSFGEVYLATQSQHTNLDTTTVKFGTGMVEQWRRIFTGGTFNSPTNLQVSPLDGSVATVGYTVSSGIAFATGIIYTSGGDIKASLGQLAQNDFTTDAVRARYGDDGMLYISARGGTAGHHFIRTMKFLVNGALFWSTDYSTNDPSVTTMATGTFGDVYLGGFSASSNLAWFAKYRQVSAFDDGPYIVNPNGNLVVDSLHGILANDLYVTNDTTLLITSGASHGTLNVANNGGFTYGPSTDYSGLDSFTYSLSKQGVTSTATATINVRALVVSLTFSPNPTAGNSTSTGTVTLNAPASAASGTYNVAITYGDSIVSGPSTAAVSVGSKTGTFTVTTQQVTSSANHTITATLNGVAVQGTLTVGPISIATLTLDPSTVYGGASSTGTVTLNGSAPTGGTVISLTTTVPHATLSSPSITIAAGSSTGTFTVNTVPVTKTEVGSITATYNGVGTSKPFTLHAPLLSAFTLTKSTFPGGGSVTGKVTLTGTIPSGGVSVGIVYGPSASGPASILVGASGIATFTVKTAQVSSQTASFVKANFDGTTINQGLTLLTYVLTSLVISPNAVYGTYDTTGFVTLNGAAPTGGFTVSLSGMSVITVPASVFVGEGTSTAPFPIHTGGVTANLNRTVTATFRGVSRTASLLLKPIPVSSVVVTPTSVHGGAPSTGKLTLTVAPGKYSVAVKLVSSNPSVASVPSAVGVKAGTKTGTFTVTTHAVSTTTSVTITASIGSSAATVKLTVTH